MDLVAFTATMFVKKYQLSCFQKYLRVKTKQEFLLSGVQWYTVTLDARKVVGHSVTGNVQEPSHTSKLHNFVQMQ